MTQKKREKKKAEEMDALFVTLSEKEQKNAIHLLYSLQSKQHVKEADRNKKTC